MENGTSSMTEELLKLIEDRLKKKLNKAREAYVKERARKATVNCQHSGRALSDGVRVCKLACMGENEAAARQCWNEKATWCPEFTRKSDEALREEFKQFSEAEIRIRWPSVGELLWMKKQAENLIQVNTERLKTTEPKAG